MQKALRFWFALLLFLMTYAYSAAQTGSSAAHVLQASGKGARANAMEGQVLVKGPRTFPYQVHPVMPAKCQDCMPLPDRFTANTRHYAIGGNVNELYILQANGPINYRDAAGQWQPYAVAPRWQGSQYVNSSQDWPASFDRQSGRTQLALPQQNALRWNGDGVVWLTTRQDPQPRVWHSLQAAGTGLQTKPDAVLVQQIAPGVDKEIIYGKNALKTNYILNQRPDVPADGYLHWEDTFELPEGWRLVPDAEKGHRTTAGWWLGDLVLQDAQGQEVGRIAKPEVYDSADRSAWTPEQARAHMDHLRQRGLDLEDYGYTWQQAGNQVRVSVVISTNLLLMPEAQYPIIIDPLVVVTASNTTTFGSQQGVTCIGPDIDVVVPGGYQIVNVDASGASRASGSCGFCFFGICFPSGSFFPCWIGNTGYFFQGPCGNATGDCGGNFPGTCTITSDLNTPAGVPFLANCVVPQCTDYTVTFQAGIRNFSDCGGASCASTTCFFSNPGDVVMGIRARNLELTVTSSVGSPPTINLCQGEPVTLTAAASFGVSPYTYSWAPTTNLTCAPTCNTAAVTANAVSVGSITYTVAATDACGNTTTSDVAVVTNPGIANNTITTTTALALCAGSNALLNGSTPAGGTGSYTYQWELSQDAAPFAAIVGGTGISHTAAFPVAGTYALRRRANSGDCTPSYSNTVTFTISATDPIANNTITTPATVLCDGDNPASFGDSTPPTLSGGDGVTYTYQWEQQVNGGAWAPIGGATAATYDPPVLALVGGNNTTYAFRRGVSSGTCVNAYSNTLTLTVYVGFAGNTLTAPATTTLCAGGDPANIVGSVPTVGQGALVPITYQWQQNVNSGGWTDIGGAAAQGLTFVKNTYYSTWWDCGNYQTLTIDRDPCTPPATDRYYVVVYNNDYLFPAGQVEVGIKFEDMDYVPVQYDDYADAANMGTLRDAAEHTALAAVRAQLHVTAQLTHARYDVRNAYV